MKLTYTKDRVLTLDDGTEIDLAYFAEGAFTKAYFTKKTVYALVRYKDPSKQILVDIGKRKHIPDCDFLGTVGKRLIYRMPLYRRISPKFKDAKAQARALQKIAKTAYEDVNKQFPDTDYNRVGSEAVKLMLCRIRKCSVLPKSLIRALEKIGAACLTLGDSVTFEFQDRNLCVDTDGSLILLDVVFDMNAL